MNKPKKTLGHKIIQILAFTLAVLIFLLIILGAINSLITHFTINEIVNKKTISEEELFLFKEFVSNCHSVLNASAITYLVTLIIALLATLLLNRIEKIESLINRNESLEKEIINSVSRSAEYNIFLTRIETVFNIASMIDNLSVISSDFSQIGVLCSRISILLENINDDFIHQRKLQMLQRLHKEEKRILMMYVEDTIGLLGRASNTLGTKEARIKTNVDKRLMDMDQIKDRIEILIIND